MPKSKDTGNDNDAKTQLVKPGEESRNDIKKRLLTRAQVAKRLHTSYQTVSRREANGDLAPAKIVAGVRYYDPADVDELADNSTEVQAAQLLREARGIIDSQLGHNEAILGVSTGIALKMLELQAQTIAAAQARIESLEQKHDEWRGQIEAAQGAEHDRKLATMAQEAALALRSEAFDALKQLLPHILGPLLARFGLNAANGNAAPALEMLELAASLTPEQMENHRRRRCALSGASRATSQAPRSRARASEDHGERCRGRRRQGGVVSSAD